MLEKPMKALLFELAGTRAKRVLVWLGLSLPFFAVLVAVLVGLELFLRWRDKEQFTLRRLACAGKHPRMAFTLRPNCLSMETGPGGGYEFRTNEDGFRDRARAEFSGGALLVLGDSHIQGIGLAEEDTIPRQLELRLRSRLGIPLLNAGLQNLGPSEELIRADEALAAYPVRGAFWFLNPTDAYDEVAYQAADKSPRPFFFFGLSDLLGGRSFLVLKLQEYYNMSRPYVSALRGRDFDPARHCVAFPALHSRLKALGAPLIFVSMGHGPRAMWRAGYKGLPPNMEFYDRLLACARGTGTPVIDAMEFFSDRPELFWKNDWHMNPRGTAAFADYLAPKLLFTWKAARTR